MPGGRRRPGGARLAGHRDLPSPERRAPPRQSARSASAQSAGGSNTRTSGIGTTKRPPHARMYAIWRRSRPAGSRAGRRRSPAASRGSPPERDRYVRSRRERALLVRVAIHGVVEEVRADAAVVQQRVALARRPVADDALPSSFASMRKSSRSALGPVHLPSKLRRGRSCRSQHRSRAARSVVDAASDGNARPRRAGRRSAANRRASAVLRRRTAPARGRRRRFRPS